MCGEGMLVFWHEGRATVKATSWWSGTVVSVALCLPATVGAQAPVGALAVDEGQGEQYGWAVDFDRLELRPGPQLWGSAARGARWR